MTMSDELIPEGRYIAKATEAVLARTNNGDPQVAVGFELTAGEGTSGRLITYYGSLSNTVVSKGKNEGKKVAELTFEALETCGWDGEALSAGSLATCVGNEVSLVIAHEEDQNGKLRHKVKFINSPNAIGAAVKDRMNDNDANNVTKQFQALLLKRKQQRQAKSSAQGGSKQKPPANAGDAWEGPEPDDYADLG